jgi:hypothetical protein
MPRQPRPFRKKTESLDWKDDAAEMVWCAFGVAGDIDFVAARRTPEKILECRQEGERLEAARMEYAGVRLSLPPKEN